MIRADLHSSCSVHKARESICGSLHPLHRQVLTTVCLRIKKGWVVLFWRSHVKAVTPPADTSLWFPWVLPFGDCQKFRILATHISENGILLGKKNNKTGSDFQNLKVRMAHGDFFKIRIAFQPNILKPNLMLSAQSLSSAQLFSTLWTIVHQAPLPMGFSRQEYRSGLPFPSLGDLESTWESNLGLLNCSQILLFFFCRQILYQLCLTCS